MTHNAVPFVDRSGQATNGLQWQLVCRPNDDTLAARQTTWEFDRVLRADRMDIYYLTLHFWPDLPEESENAVFYSRHCDSRRIGIYYTTVRPLCETPVFAQRGWRRRYHAFSQILKSQQMRSARIGTYGDVRGFLIPMDSKKPLPSPR